MAFEHVSTEAILKGKFRKETAWNLIKDFSRYPVIMENVDEVKILEINDTESKSEWFVTIEGAPLRWLEKDFYDRENLKLRFESIEGDFDTINGNWRIENYNHKGIKISFELDYSLGIPVIEEILGPVLKQKMKGNIDSMINSVKEELTKKQVEEREFKRIPIGEQHNVRINGNEIRPEIINISQGGIMFDYDGKPDLLSIMLKINGITIESDIIINDLKKKNYRAVFKEVINTDELEKLVNILLHKTIPVQDIVVVKEKITTPAE